MVLLGCATGPRQTPFSLHNFSRNINCLRRTSGDPARPVENDSTASQRSSVAHRATSVGQKPNAGITDSPALPPLNPLSAVWRVYDIIVEMLAMFAATAALIFRPELVVPLKFCATR
jgi:hypothetical protein